MTDRLKGVWVAFERDIRDDDAVGVIEAMKQLRGVVAVTTHAADASDWMARERIRRELGDKLWQVLYPESKPT